MLIGYDTETTGIDLWHGCSPFAYAAVDDDAQVIYEEWEVDPFTRLVDIPAESAYHLGTILDENEIVCHNVGFDMMGSEIILGHPDYEYEHDWDWDGIHDTLLASHALRNLWPHDLKTLRSVFLQVGRNQVDLLQKATNHARRICRSKAFKEQIGEWRIADASDPHWPAIHRAPKSKDEESGWWLMDMWLPSTIVRLAPEFLPPVKDYEHMLKRPDYPGWYIHPWENLCREYCIEDAMSTLVLWNVLREALEDEGLYDQYLERKELLKVCYRTESNGVSIHPHIKREIKRYEDTSAKHRRKAHNLMKKRGCEDPNINSSQQLQHFIYGEIGCPVKTRTKTGQPSTKADVIESLADDLPSHHWGNDFFNDLLKSRRNEKAGNYLSSYLKWSTPHGRISDLYWRKAIGRTSGEPRHQSAGHERAAEDATTQDTDRVPRRDRSYLHTSINITGTKFTRQSTSSPNLQNVGTGKEEGGEVDYQLRYSFGPAPGRYWLAIDYANIELRIWAYLCGNREFINAFEQGESIHLLIAKELHPGLRKYDSTDDIPKELYPLYKRTKNGNFAIIYGATPRTAELTYKVKGAYYKLAERFPEVRIFTRQLHNEVSNRGYIETLTGYRLYIPPEDPHKAVSGKVQGTAGSVIGRAMVNTQRVLDEHCPEGKLILQVHDELVFDFPNEVSLVDPENEYNSLYGRIEHAMTCIGDEIGIPLAVSGELITDNWSEGVSL